MPLEDIIKRAKERERFNAIIQRAKERQQTPGGPSMHGVPWNQQTTTQARYGVHTFPGMTPEETRRTIEGPGEATQEDIAVPAILGAAAAPLFAPAIGLGLASWKTATWGGRALHAVADAAIGLAAEYGVVEPLAKHAGRIHPWLEPLVGITGGVTAAITIEQLFLESTLKALTKSAPRFWSDQFGAFVEKGLIPSAHFDDISQIAKRADGGDVEAQRRFLAFVRDEAYNKHLVKKNKEEALAAIRAQKALKKAEPTEGIINELKSKTATGGNLSYSEHIRVAKAAERDAIFEYTEEFDRSRKHLAKTRAEQEYVELPNTDFIKALVAGKGIDANDIAKIFKDTPEVADTILKRLKAHKGLITEEGTAQNLIKVAETSDTKDLRVFLKQLSEAPSLAKITRQKEALLRTEFDRLYRDEIFARTAEKQSQYLARIMGSTSTPISTAKLTKELASRRTAGRVVKELIELRRTVTRYGRSLTKEGVAAEKAKGKARLEATRSEHQEAVKQLLARIALAKEATKISSYLKDSLKVAIHPEYREQLHNFLKPLFVKPSKFREDLLVLPENMFQFLNRKHREGMSFGTELVAEKYHNLIQTMASRPVGLKNLTVDQLRDVRDFVKAFRFVASNEKHIISGAHKLWKNGIIQNISKKARTTVPSSRFSKKNKKTGTSEFVRPDRFAAASDLIDGSLVELKRVEFIVRQLDGWEDFGDAWKHIFKPIADAEALSHRLGERIFDAYRDIMKSHRVAAGISRRFSSKYWMKRLPAIGTLTDVSKEKAISMAFNMGSPDNAKVLQRHLNGDAGNLSLSDIRKYLKDNLSDADLKFVDDIHRFFDTEVFPLLARVNKEVTGETLQRVKGKYYPIAPEDYYKSGTSGDNLLNVLLGATTKNRGDLNKSMIMLRHGGVERLDLSLDVIVKHLRDSVHLATHWKALQDVQGIVRAKNFKEAVVDTMGKNIYAQFDPWLRNIARPSALDPAHKLMERSMRYLRGSVSIAVLGLKAVTAAKQSLSLITALPEIGIVNTMGAVSRMMVNPVNFVRAVSAASPQMHYRMSTWQREIAEIIQKNVGKEIGLLGRARNVYFYMIHTVDRMTASVVWHGAYLKGLDKFGGDATKATDFADMIVRKTQPAASPKDLPRVMRDTETKRFISMFQGYFNIWQNQVDEIIRRGLAKNISKTEILSTLAFLTAAPVVAWRTMATGAKVIAGREVEPEDVAKTLGKELATMPFAGIPIVNSLMSSAIMGYDPKLTPVSVILEDAATVANLALHKSWDEDATVTMQDKRSTIRLIGYGLKIPSNALITFLEGALRLVENDTNDPTELIVRADPDR